MASGKVLEETYRKWVQYKEDCIKMIENEALPQGMETLHVSSTESSCKREYGKRGKGGRTRKMSNYAILNCIKNDHVWLLC